MQNLLVHKILGFKLQIGIQTWKKHSEAKQFLNNVLLVILVDYIAQNTEFIDIVVFRQISLKFLQINEFLAS